MVCLLCWCNIFKLRPIIYLACCVPLLGCENLPQCQDLFLSFPIRIFFFYKSPHLNNYLLIRISTHEYYHLNILQATNLNSAFHSSLCLSCSSALKPWEQSSELVDNQSWLFRVGWCLELIVQNSLMFGIGCSELVVDQTSQFNDTWKSAPITLSVGEVMSYGEPWRERGL